MKLTMPHFKISDMMEDKLITAIVVIMLGILIAAPILMMYF